MNDRSRVIVFCIVMVAIYKIIISASFLHLMI